MWNAKGICLNESFILIHLAVKVPDTKTKPVHPGMFYMQSPILEPRRLRRPVLEKAAKPNFRAKKAAAKQKKAESCRR